MVMAKAKTVAQAQNLCCFMVVSPPLQALSCCMIVYSYYTKLTGGMQ